MDERDGYFYHPKVCAEQITQKLSSENMNSTERSSLDYDNWISSLLTARTLSSQQNVTRGSIFTSVLILNILQPNLLLAWASAFGCAPSEPWETEMDWLNSWRCIIFPRCTDGVEVNQGNSIMEEKVHLYFEGHYAKSPQVGRFVF